MTTGAQETAELLSEQRFSSGLDAGKREATLFPGRVQLVKGQAFGAAPPEEVGDGGAQPSRPLRRQGKNLAEIPDPGEGESVGHHGTLVEGGEEAAAGKVEGALDSGDDT